MKKLKFTGIFILILTLFYFGYYQLSWDEMPSRRRFERTTDVADSTFKEQIELSSKKLAKLLDSLKVDRKSVV